MPLRTPLALPGQAANLAEEGLLLRGQVLGNDDLHEHVLVAAAAAADVGHALPGEPERLPVLGACRDGDLHRALHRRDLDPISEGGLHDVDSQLVDDALVAARQVRMRLDAKHHVEVARLPATDAGLAFAAEPDLGTGVHTCRYAHGEPAHDGGAALPPALSARALEKPAGAAAGGARGLRHDRAEDGLRGASDLTCPAATGARLCAGARLGAAA